MSDAEKVDAPETRSASESQTEPRRKLALEVDMRHTDACQRHVIVKVSADDVQYYRDKALDNLAEAAAVPGFRPGRAPRQLVANFYRDKISEQVKATVVQEALAQLVDEKRFVPISEPDLNLDSIELTVDGHLTFEFDIEVRPEFELPEWKGLTLEELSYEPTEPDIERQISLMLENHIHYEPILEPAQKEDLIEVRLHLMEDGSVARSSQEAVFHLRPVLMWRDARIENADQLLVGKNAGERVAVKVQLAETIPDARWRGRLVDGELELIEVKRARRPEITPELLRELGCSSYEQLRDRAREQLVKRFQFYRDESMSQQITDALLKNARWDLPASLLRRQVRRETERLASELAWRGFNQRQIDAYTNQVRHELREEAAARLRRHFILERIAEELDITPSEEMVDRYVEEVARARGESPRRLRARLEKTGNLDGIRNLIVETLVLAEIRNHAQIVRKPFSWEEESSSAVSQSIFSEKEIPLARSDEPDTLIKPTSHG